MDFHGMSRKDLQSLCKKHGIPSNMKNSEMASRLASLFKKEDEETVTEIDFHGFKRKDLQALCKKHGIPANLKNSDMANRLASLFEETLSFTDLNEHSSVANLAKIEAVNFSEKEMEISNPESVLFAETTPPPSSVQLVVSSSESVLFVETTPPPPPVQLAVRNSESDLGVPTGHTIVKDIVPAVIADEDIITSKEVPRSVHSFGAKLAEAEAVLENSAECWNESFSSKDDERGPLDSEMQSANRHGNFSDCNTVNSSAEEQADICEVGRISAGYCVNDDSLTKAELIVSTERDCKLNVLELSGSLSIDFASLSPKEENVSECLEEDKMKDLYTPMQKAASNALDGSFVFTTRKRNLMLMEQLSENGKIRAADTVTHHNDEAAESHEVVFTSTEQVLLLGDSELYEVGKEEEHTDTNSEQKKALKTAEKADAEFDDQCAAPNTPERHPFPEESELEEASKSKECKVVELQVDFENFTGADITAKSHDMSDVLTAHSLMGDFEPDGAENEYRETKDVERHLLSWDSGLDETRKIKYKTASTCEESPEKRQRLGNSELHTAVNQERKEVEFKDESAFFTRLESRLLLGNSGHDSLGNGKSGSTLYPSHHASSPKVILKDDSVVPEGHVAAPDFIENTIADSNGSIAQKFSYSHEFTAVEELATIEKAMSLTPNEVTVQDNIMKEGLEAAQGTPKQSRLHSPHVNSVNLSDFDTEGTEITMEAESTVTLSSYVLASPAEAADEEMVRRGATLSPEEALNESAENECADMGDSYTLSEKHVRGEPNLIYGTQVKPKRQDMKENAPHSKIVENLNVTAPRTSKRQPLQDLRNIREEPNTVFKKPKTSQPKHNSPQKTCNKEVFVLFTTQHIQTGNRFAVLSDYDDC